MFKDDVKSGKANNNDLIAYVEDWHKYDYNMSLRKFLGCNEEEYVLFLRNDFMTDKIIDGWRSGVNYHPTYTVFFDDLCERVCESYSTVQKTVNEIIAEGHKNVTPVAYDGTINKTWADIKRNELWKAK